MQYFRKASLSNFYLDNINFFKQIACDKTSENLIIYRKNDGSYLENRFCITTGNSLNDKKHHSKFLKNVVIKESYFEFL